MKLKSKWKAGLFFGLAMTIFFIIKELITEENLSQTNIITIVISSLAGGLVAGILFALMAGGFKNWGFVKRSMQIQLMEGEEIKFETGANYCKGMEAAGGKLYLTTNRLYFKSHNLNLKSHELSIPLQDINQADNFKSIGILNNGLQLTLKNGTTEKFIVEEASEWKRLLSPQFAAQKVL